MAGAGELFQLKTADDLKLPLVVDLDGTLVRSDLLLESLFGRIGRDPMSAFGLLFALNSGKARFKDLLAQRVDLDVDTLPYDEAVLTLIGKARAAKRPVFLASASNEKFVSAVAARLGLFDGWFASDANSNMSAEVKAARLVEAFGEGGFDYIGNDKADLPVWAAAARRTGIRTSPKLNGRLAALGVEVLDSPKATLRQWLKLIRVHQYAKNALVFLPLLAAHKFDLWSLFNAVLAAVAFSLCASSAYILNDLIDLPADRDHPTKKDRALASGVIPITNAVVVMALMFIASVGISVGVSWSFLGVIALYFILTNAYTFSLKTKMMIDVVTLAALYSLRVIGGAAAIGVGVLGVAHRVFDVLVRLPRAGQTLHRTRHPSGPGVVRSLKPQLQVERHADRRASRRCVRIQRCHGFRALHFVRRRSFALSPSRASLAHLSHSPVLDRPDSDDGPSATGARRSDRFRLEGSREHYCRRIDRGDRAGGDLKARGKRPVGGGYPSPGALGPFRPAVWAPCF